MPDRVSGFCVYNDVAVAIRWLLDNGAKKVAYVDVDVHHGDGVESIFYDDPRVLTISLHETGQMLFPGTGFPADAGGPEALGSAVNVALPPGTADAGWLRAFHAVVPELLREFAPDILVTQHGCDSHRDDPLAHLALSIDGQRASYLALHDLAHEVAGGRWVAFGGGGYSIVDVVPRAWTHLLAVVSGTPLSTAVETPSAWREGIRERLGVRAPSLMTDGRDPAFRDWSLGYDPDTWLDRAIQATREVAYPYNGLDPNCESLNQARDKQPRRDTTSHFGESLAHRPHWGLYFSQSAHVGFTALKSWDVRNRERCAMPTNDISEVKFLTVAEVAAVMRVSKMTVYRLVHNGELPAVRVGRSFRVSEEDVNEYLKSSFFDAG